MKSLAGFILFVLIVVGVLYSLSKKEYPSIPADSVHSGTAAADCVGCHGPGKPHALKKSHPPKYECLKCHRRPAGK